MSDFLQSLFAYRQALAQHLELLRTGKLDNEFYKSGRRARKALRRARQIAAAQRIIWDCGDGARTFY